MRRVVVTGIGLLTPLGQGTELSWAALLAGKSGAGRVTTFDPTDYGCQVAFEVPLHLGLGLGEETKAPPITRQSRNHSHRHRSPIPERIEGARPRAELIQPLPAPRQVVALLQGGRSQR